jgi:hypothetical protein
MDLDRRITVLPADDHRGDEAWKELEDVLEELGDAAERLARVSATQLTEVRAKAEVLTILMRANAAEDGPVVPQDKTQALILSLTDDLAGMPGDTAASADRWTTASPVVVRPAQRAFSRWLLNKYINPYRNRRQ